MCVCVYIGFTCDSDGKESAYNVGGSGSIPEPGRSPGEGNGNPFQYSCLENSLDRGALVGYSPWVTELDTTDQLHLHFHVCVCVCVCMCIYV